jgi:hypothetical protein
MIKSFKNYCSKYMDYDFVIIGAGSSIKKYENKIKNFISDKKTIGINNITHLFVPDFHVWTNNQRLKNYGSCINDSSELVLGDRIRKEIIEQYNIRSFIQLRYEDSEEVPLCIREGKIYGYFRTAGCLSIMVAHCLGAKNIYIVGMDGYTLYPKDDLTTMKEDHHCYGSGYTDDASWEKCLKKDELVYKCLHSIKNYGVNFSILTPTVFKDFFDPIIFEVIL